MQDIPVGERIRLFRLGRGLTQEQLAGLADVSPSCVSKAERGLPIDRRLAPLSKVAKVLGVTVVELVGQRLSLPNDGKGAMESSTRSAGRSCPACPACRPGGSILSVSWRTPSRPGASAKRASTPPSGAILPGLIVRGEQARRDLDGTDRSTACRALAIIRRDRRPWLAARDGGLHRSANHGRLDGMGPALGSGARCRSLRPRQDAPAVVLQSRPRPPPWRRRRPGAGRLPDGSPQG
jgi:DNA-binding XRE family transcriptional regulator